MIIFRNSIFFSPQRKLFLGAKQDIIVFSGHFLHSLIQRRPEGHGSVMVSCTCSCTHAVKLSFRHQRPRRSAGTFYMMDLCVHESNLLPESLAFELERLKEHANVTPGEFTCWLCQSFHKSGA